MPTPASTVTGSHKRAIQIALTALMTILLMGVTLAALRPPAVHSSLAAIVNTDEPIEVDGQLAPMGRQLSAEFALLDGPFEWEITTLDRAEAGLLSGRYQAAVIIPEDFSANVTSLSSLSAAVQATVGVEVPPGASSAQTTQVELEVWKATANLGSMMTEEFVTGIFGGLGEMGEQLKTAADGAEQLADGTEQAQSGTDALADGNRQLADGAGLAAEGIGLLGDGADQLADGAGQAKDGINQIADGNWQLADGAGQAKDGINQIADGNWQLADGAGQAKDGINQIADGNWQLADGAGQAATGLEQLAEGTDELGTGLNELAGGASALVDGTVLLAGGLGELSANSEDLREGMNSLAVGAADLTEGVTSTDQEQPGLAPAAEDLADGAEKLSAGLTQLVGRQTGPDEEPEGLIGYVTGVNQVVGPLSEATTQINGIVQQLAPYLEDADANKAAAKEFLEELKAQYDLFCTEDPTNPICQEGNNPIQDFWNNIDGVYALIDEAIDALKELPDEMATATDGLRELKDGGDALINPENGAPALADGLQDYAAGVRQYSDGMNQFAEGMTGFSAGAQKLAAGVGDYTGGVDQIAGGASDLADGVSQLADGTTAAADGVGALSSGAWQAADGVGQLKGAAELLGDGAEQAANGVGQLEDGAEQLGDGAEQAANGVGQLGDGAEQLGDGARQASDGVEQLGDGAGQLADGADQLGDGLGQISTGMSELANGLGLAGDAVPSLDEQQAEALGQTLAAPVERPTLVLGTEAGPAIGLALLLWLAALLLQSVYPAAVTFLTSSTRSSASLMLSALWKPAVWTATIGAVGGLILAIVGKPGAGLSLALILFGAVAGAVFAAVQQALALVFTRGWITVSVAALVLGVSAALASAQDSLLSKLAGLLPAGEAADIFAFLLVPGTRSAAAAVLMLALWGGLALLISTSATAGKRRTPEAAETVIAV